MDEILDAHDHDPKRMLQILESTQAAFGFLPVAALKRISERTGAWYATIYGTASYYGHLRFEPPSAKAQAKEVAARRADRRRLPRGARRLRSAASAAAEGRRVSAILPFPQGLALHPARPRRRRGPRTSTTAVKAGAFEGLRRAVRELGPEGTIAEVKASGLRGRGGAGHLTADKWRTRPRDGGETARYVVANGYGADPAASTDRRCSRPTRTP